MKECPNCGEMLGDTMEVCFNCSYSFKYGQVVRKGEEKQAEKDMKERKELQVLREQQEEEQRRNNPFYEYKVVIVNNLADGQVDYGRIQAELDAHASLGWRLHSVFNNELGKTSTAVAIGFMGSSVNATIDQTVIIFERCIKAGTHCV
ncbi:MAG: DUF4177 domain-containing protein [Acetatifactor sp.]|nr:DUF4177 domain-containing protein [Acetatifactor sp.]